MMCPKWKTTDGFEMQIGVNYLGNLNKDFNNLKFNFELFFLILKDTSY